ncbi:MAG TPA: hypothetical protein VMT45_09645 [Thermoanaerobaculaceae bacterium]|nr:hypothetical protein [Thermoanaerobaculaceae bacterium]
METLPGRAPEPEPATERADLTPRGRLPFIPIFLVLALFLTLFDGVFLRGETFCERDLAALERPLRVLLVRLWQESQGLPLWNPLVNMGQPFAANPHAAVFHPLSWLFLILPWELAFRLQVLLPLLASFAGMILLLRTMGRSLPAALLAGCSWGFGGLMLSLTNLLPMLLTVAPVPATLAFAVRLVRRGSRADALGLAACFALVCAGGEPVTVLAALLLLAAAGAGLSSDTGPAVDRGQNVLVPFARVAGAALMGAAAAAVVILPGLSLAARSVRSAGLSLERSETWSLPPIRLLELVLPHLMGHTEGITAAAYWGSSAYPVKQFPLIYSIYPGLLIAALAVAALGRPRRERLVWASIGGAGLLLAFGGHAPLWLALRTVVPFSGGLRYPEKLIVLTVFAVTVLAAAGLDDLLARERRAMRRVSVLLATAAGLAAVAGITVFAVTTWRGAAVWESLGIPIGATAVFAQRFPADCAVACSVGLASLLGLSVLARRGSARATALLAAALVVDLLVAGKPLVPTRPPAEVDALSPVLRPLIEAPAAGRLFNLAEWHPPGPIFAAVPTSPLPAVRGIATAMDTDADLTQLDWSARATRLFWRTVGADSRAMAPLLLRRGVGAVLAYKDAPRARAALTFLRDPQPDAFCADRIVSFDGDEAWVAAVLSLGPEVRTATLVEGQDALGLPSRPASCRAEIVARSPERLDIAFSGAGPVSSLLAINQTWDEGWSATMDGQATRLWRTDVSLSAVVVPPGRHRVKLLYRDRAIERSRFVSGAAVLLGLSIGGIGLARRRKP